jgi:hypothetical protein
MVDGSGQQVVSLNVLHVPARRGDAARALRVAVHLVRVLVAIFLLE